ncbi:uncharacterized protein LOC114724339 [Neltuma alba]|uniref:uncharacterized protein LOC114724339 n=1 Tax=Neltuma alba TaxID=207710 RepID=UPI0010A4430F|nr:uncharacterized protein LOC114724339 [Prosopis alba]
MRQATKKRKEVNEEAVVNDVEGNESGTTICKGIIRYHRGCRPAHYMLQIQSYSVLAASKVERYESDVFQAGVYNWRMILYLHGKREANKDRHISLYLEFAESQNELPVDWEVWAHFKFFIHDQINDKYMVIQDAQNQLERFCSDKTECGFDELLLLDAFRDPNNGFLIGDSCAFGAEIFVAECSAKRECVSTILKPPENGTYTWKLNSFSQIKAGHCNFCNSESFTVGGKKWLLRVYPKGAKGCSDEYLSIFLVFNERGGMSEKRCYAEFTLRVKNQLTTLRNFTVNGEKWFSGRDNSWGSNDFMKLKDLKDTKKGYYVNDTVIIECQI